jgi:hypothetical protein
MVLYVFLISYVSFIKITIVCIHYHPHGYFKTTCSSEMSGSLVVDDFMKDLMYLPSGSNELDWSSDDIIPLSPNAMESSRSHIFQGSKTWRPYWSIKSQFILSGLFYGKKLPSSDISDAFT